MKQNTIKITLKVIYIILIILLIILLLLTQFFELFSMWIYDSCPTCYWMFILPIWMFYWPIIKILLLSFILIITILRIIIKEKFTEHKKEITEYNKYKQYFFYDYFIFSIYILLILFFLIKFQAQWFIRWLIMLMVIPWIYLLFKLWILIKNKFNINYYLLSAPIFILDYFIIWNFTSENLIWLYFSNLLIATTLILAKKLFFK